MNSGAALFTTLALLTLLTGCSSPRERATEGASNAVRAQAERARDRLADVLANGHANDDRSLLKLNTSLTGAEIDGFIFGQNVSPDGSVRIDVAFTERRNSSGGWGGYVDVGARLCVNYVGRFGSSAEPEMKNIACSSTIPRDPDAPNVDVIVTLDD